MRQASRVCFRIVLLGKGEIGVRTEEYAKPRFLKSRCVATSKAFCIKMRVWQR